MPTEPSGAASRSIRVLFTAGTVGGLDDRQLLEQFTGREGDRGELAFAAMVERHGPMVLRVCQTILRDPHLAEDAFQATFLILALKARSIRGGDSLTSWLYSVAYNVAATARGAAVRRQAHEWNAGQMRPRAVTPDNPTDVGPVIHDELNRMPEHQRAVIMLCDLEGLTQHEAARRLGWPLGTVQSRLARGRARLRARLARRGFDPSASVPILPMASGLPRVNLPAALVDSTVRLGVTMGAARALAVGSIPVAVMKLAKGTIDSMFVNKVVLAGMAALVAAGLIAGGVAVYAYQGADPEPVIARQPEPAQRQQPVVDPPDHGLLAVTGIVRTRDGLPAADASVRSINGLDETLPVVRTDHEGRFRLEGMFDNGGRLHASSADGKYQTVVNVPSVATRTVFAAPLELRLLPALTHRVTVSSQGRPVAGAHVAAVGNDFHVQGVTGSDGVAALKLPAKARLSEVVAWHDSLGLMGKRDLDKHAREGTTELSLLAPAPHKIRVVDVSGRGIGGLELGVSVHPEAGDWIVAKHFKEAHVRTAVDGTAIVPWAPAGKLRYVEVDILGSDWKVDETDRDLLAAGVTTVHARRERIANGRLIMPEGASAQGILVTGFGFGPGTNGDIASARARKDGTFELRVPSDHGFVLGIEDLTWASDPWTGMILADDSAQPAEISIKVYTGTPLKVRVTRGSDREPVVNGWLDLGAMANLAWIDSKGKKQTGVGGAQTWLRTDADGVARASVGKGRHRLRLSDGDWTEECTINVTSEKPVEVAFHRVWKGKQRITGRLMKDGVAYVPSRSIVARAWSPQQPMGFLPLVFEPTIERDGTFTVDFDAQFVSLFFIDRDRERCGFAERVDGEERVAVAMEPMSAEYGGILRDENNQPLSGRAIEIYPKNSDRKAIIAQKTDATGRFRFTNVPCNVPLQLQIADERDRPNYFLADRDRIFNPGEVREDDELKPRRIGR